MLLTATAASATTTIHATTSEADNAGYPRFGFAHDEPPSLVFEVIESLDRCLSLGVCVHFDKAKPLAAPRFSVSDNLGALDGAEWREPLLQIH
jgi:hypothetical protein